ncbi:MAG: Smr/MutS family protein [Deltaproteobacteria bacterium]|nr:Smr/MutS family protein [Deltaproteobacteria bacterium]
MNGSPWEAALAALEWGKITARLSGHASSEPGRVLCSSLTPGTDLDAIRASLEENRDGRRMLLQDGPLPLDGVKEVAEEVAKAAKGASLSPLELLSVGSTARTGERARRFFDDRRGKYPRLAHHARAIPPLREIAEEIAMKIDSEGNVPDRASPALGTLRRNLASVRVRLQETADRIVSSPRYSRHVQESYATVRSGRVVIPFKAASKGLFQGIVHDSSQSGQTVFFEPEELVHLNNEARMAELEVEREVARILAELSSHVARRSDELLLALSLLARLDFIQARALLADELSGAEPSVNASGEVRLPSARHPLLVLSGRPVVPNDLSVGRPYLCLVLTGPNAGGKTVALKTLGILTVMAMAGLSIPASPDATVSTFGSVFVAVGDEQSVERDLSTYSAHIRRLNEILRGADRGSLVLLDEVVSGTDPREGAAIARAFLETLADREVRVVATTHFEELKGIAFTDRRFENGSMAFDGDHLRPTYRLSLGVPGRSMGMEIARSLGFPGEVLARAAGYLSGPGPDLTEVIDRLERERERLRAETAEMATRRKEAEEVRRKLEADREKVRSEESRVVSQARQRMREEVRKAEGELARIMEEMRKDRRIDTVRKATTVLNEWKEKARIAEEDPAVRTMVSRSAPADPGATLHPGQKVFVASLAKEAEVASPSGPDDREVEVAAGGMKLRVPREQVRVFPSAGGSRERRGGGGSRSTEASPAAVHIQTPENTLDLRGMYVDDALPEIDAFLDRLSLAQAPHAFLIHGHGTGALKAGVRRHLAKSPYAKRSLPAPREQGGDGVTIVLLC